MIVSRRRTLQLAAGAAALVPAPHFAQAGPDKAIQAAAAKEGKLVLLLQTSGSDEALAAMIRKFRQHYPFIEVSYTLQTTLQVVGRFNGERNNKRGLSDCVMLPSNLRQTDVYVASGAVAEYVVSGDAGFPAEAKRSGIWYAWSADRPTTVYRKGALSEAEKKLIRTFKGLGDPRFKGRLAINTVANPISATTAYTLLEQPDKGLWAGLVANKPRVKPSSPALMTGLLSGEYDVTIFGSYAAPAKLAHDGAPIEFGHTALVPTQYIPVAISALAPHANAAKLWQDWVTSKEGQDLWVDLVAVPSARRDVAKPWPERQPWFFDTPGSHKPVDWADFAKKEAAVVARFKQDFQTG